MCKNKSHRDLPVSLTESDGRGLEISPNSRALLQGSQNMAKDKNPKRLGHLGIGRKEGMLRTYKIRQKRSNRLSIR